MNRHLKNFNHELLVEGSDSSDSAEDPEETEDGPTPAKVSRRADTSTIHRTQEMFFDLLPGSYLPRASPGYSPTQSSNIEEQPVNDYFPFKNQLHFQMCLLYHGSYRKYIDRNMLVAFLDILNVHVKEVPTVQEVINFNFPFWEEQLLRTRVNGGEVISYLSPKALIKMQLAHPKKSFQFDRCWR